MALNPCLCIPLQKGVKILAIVDAIFNLILFKTFSNVFFQNLDKGAAATVGVLALFITMLQFLLALRLHGGAKNEDIRKCRSWVISTVVIITIYIIILVFDRTSESFGGAELIVFLVLIFYKVFGIAVVVGYTELLKQNDQTGGDYIYPTVTTRPRRQDPIYPPPQVYTVDLPPSYFEIQNETKSVEPPPPYSTDLVTVPQSPVVNLSIFNLIGFKLFLIAILSSLFSKGEYEMIDGIDKNSIVTCGAIMLITSLQFFFALRLLSGAKNEDSGKCRSWLSVTVVIITIYIVILVSNRNSDAFQGGGLVVFLVIIFYKVFGIVVVVSYILLKHNDPWGRGPIYPTVAIPRPDPIPPTSQIFTVDAPPSYFQIQNETQSVELPPPYSTDLLKNSQNTKL
ncbi:hypothetical protein Ocin01_15937 [Orchesella cincta]|uniref:Uncharacterized protein n=1 Tax=Orchesella cincta TaxID=48709 RepID=A0A1D2MCP9_ORCCI|nr:hypothetical protein Ocin01_15937 [Orchesella cincta]